jgi:hypothetical protein
MVIEIVTGNEYTPFIAFAFANETSFIAPF